MGMMTAIHCDACGYHRDRMIRGIDCGFAGWVQAISCSDCRDARVIKLGDSDTYFDHEDLQPLPTDASCPECGGDHIVAWRPPNPCPKCGETMHEWKVPWFSGIEVLEVGGVDKRTHRNSPRHD
jgi:hypothetical protein